MVINKQWCSIHSQALDGERRIERNDFQFASYSFSNNVWEVKGQTETPNFCI